MRALFSLVLFVLGTFVSACVETRAIDDGPATGYTPVAPPTASSTRTPASPDETPVATSTPAGTPTPQFSAACDNPFPSAAASPATSASPELTTTPNPRIVAASGVPTPEPFEPAPFLDDFALEAEIREALGDEVDGFAVVTKDLETGSGARINADQVFYSASIFKLFVMYELFHQESLDMLQFSDQLVITPYYDAFGLGPRDTQLCQQLSVAQAMAAMLSISDNAAAVLLQDLVGAGNINGSLAALGLTDSYLDPEDIPITAQDMALLLEAIGSGKAVDREASETMVALMTLEQFDNGLASGLPAGTIVAHKTGNWSDAIHDVGIVFAPDTTYLVVILSDGRDIGMIEDLSRLIYDYYTKPE